jgi:hypothetical protein
MDSSGYVSSCVLSQYNNSNILHPLAYFPKKYYYVVWNYEIYDKELMAIFQAFDEWHLKFESIINPICTLFCQNNLEYFLMTKL